MYFNLLQMNEVSYDSNIQYDITRSANITVIIKGKELYICSYIATWLYLATYVHASCDVLKCVATTALKPCHPLLKAPENGERTVIKVDGFVKHISFSCNLNYLLKGKSLTTCNNGTWSSSTPTCIKP